MVNKLWRRGLLALTVGAAMLMAGCGGNEKVGVVDFERVARESGQAQHITQELNAKHTEIINRLKEAQANLPAEEFKKKEAEAKRELQIYQMSKQQQFEAQVKSQAAIIAKEKKLGTIMYEQSVHYNGVDVTDDLIKRLKVNDKPAPAADKKDAAPAKEEKK